MCFGIDDDPIIRCAERTGYPSWASNVRTCAHCGDPVTDRVYLIDGQEECEYCFRDYITELLAEPEKLADKMGIENRLVEAHDEEF